MPTGSLLFLALGGLLCLCGALLGIMVERRRLQFVIRDQAARNVEFSRRITEAERMLAEERAGKEALSGFLFLLPEVVRQIHSHMSRRDVASLLAKTLEQLFEPEMIRVYLTYGRDELVLEHARGGEGDQVGHRVRVGEGKIGVAARHQLVMNRDDMLSDSMCRRIDAGVLALSETDPDLIAPMLHKEEGRTLGVISIGGLGRRYPDEKRMMKLVADIGSLALLNLELFARLQDTANRDALTNLATRRVLSSYLGQLTHKAEQSHAPLSVIIFDIDHFKRFNDTYGHLAGDEILKAVAAIIRRQLRRDDIAARYGGEEFVVVLPNSTKEDALRTAEKIRLVIERHPFPCGNGVAPAPGRVTISGGVASLRVDGRTSQEILSAADQALYMAKERGRNQVRAYVSRYLSDDEEEIDAQFSHLER